MATASTSRSRRSLTTSQFDQLLANLSRYAMLLIAVLALIVCFSLAHVILAPIALAMVVGLMFGPVADLVERRGLAPALSAGIVVLLLLFVIGAFAALFAGPLSEWIARVPLIWEKLRMQVASLKEPLESLSAVQDQLKSLMGSDAAMTVEVQDGSAVTDVALMAPSLLADILLFLAGLYFFLATRHHIRISVLSLCFSRKMRWRVAHIFRDVELKVSRFLLSAALINLGVGVATTLVMWALGMPSPLLWGALAALLNFIPYVGQAIMFVVLAAVALGTRSDPVGILAPVIAYGAINLTADQIVFPHLVGRALTLNPFLIFVSIAFWLWLWGPMGGFIAVPTLLVLQSIVLHIFPSTQKLSAVIERKLEAKAAIDMREAEPQGSVPEPPPAAKLAPSKRKPRARKTAVASP
ncbi:MAG: AI-2E family transporter [Devosia sp.]